MYYIKVESRIAFEFNEGFYTIGPCGEEMLSAYAAIRNESAVPSVGEPRLSMWASTPFITNSEIQT